ncbi:MAG: cytochrome c biogenesis protein CcdA [Phycisphaerales bacterium]|nr:MAG: cytochrome c biogenesis protein CcdA [Phycisphaerales bacterium]
MLEAFSENLAEVVQSNPWIAPLAAFAGGLLTAANPCVIAMVPLMVGYVAGQSQRAGEQKRRVWHSFLLSLTFAIGLTLMFGILFLATWGASSILRATWWSYIAGGVCLLMGLHLLGVLHFTTPVPSGVQPKQKGFIGALMLGLLFGLISLPCAGPVLLALLAVVPLKGMAFGAVLLVSYSLGHCGLILIGGTSMGLVQKMADSKGWTRGMDFLRRVAGLLIIGVGAWVLFVL